LVVWWEGDEDTRNGGENRSAKSTVEGAKIEKNKKKRVISRVAGLLRYSECGRQCGRGIPRICSSLRVLYRQRTISYERYIPSRAGIGSTAAGSCIVWQSRLGPPRNAGPRCMGDNLPKERAFGERGSSLVASPPRSQRTPPRSRSSPW
jgi:hypothetical protein